MGLLIPDSGLLFWMLLSFGIVFFLLAKFGFLPITGMVEERKQYIDHALESAKKANAEYADLKQKSEEILGEANKQQAEILKEAILSREKILSEAKERASLEGQKQLETARKQIQEEKEDAIRDIRRQVALLSVDIAEKVLRKNLDEDHEQQEMIDRLLDEITAPKS
ncbi:MAG: F0F1 ATP synthase subunit B [Bacteroides sp.]|nr:F0F1 ATP synthase subunit B [Bacteroides sp.]